MTPIDTSDVTTPSGAGRDAPFARTNATTGTVLVTGGTGTLGKAVVPLLRSAGRDVRVLSRKPPAITDAVTYVAGDLTTGEGVEAAVGGVSTILHLAGTSTGDDSKARTLVEAVRATGSRPHLVYISVVGAERVPVRSRVDRMMFGYFASKRAAEIVIADSGLPWTTLRATQFHDLMLMMVQGMAKLPVIPLASGFRFQPVDTGEVAERLVELAAGTPSGLVDDIAGPRTYTMKAIVRSYLRAAGKHRLTVRLHLPGKAAAAHRAGANLAADHAVGQRSWEQFLVDRVAAQRPASGTS
jgi:uncharacterized protein YbjT (DUF2867 family)